MDVLGVGNRFEDGTSFRNLIDRLPITSSIPKATQKSNVTMARHKKKVFIDYGSFIIAQSNLRRPNDPARLPQT